MDAPFTFQQETWKHPSGKRSARLSHTQESLLNQGGVEGTIHQTEFLERPQHRMVIKRWVIPGSHDAARAEKICRARAEHAVYIHTTLKRLGLPVPTTYRLHETKPEVLMTDLSRNGTCTIFTPNNEQNLDTAVAPRMTMTELLQAMDAMKELSTRAAADGVVLGGDAFFFIRNPQRPNEIEARLADYGGCQQFARPRSDGEDFEEDIAAQSLVNCVRALHLLIPRYGPQGIGDVTQFVRSHGFPEVPKTMWD